MPTSLPTINQFADPAISEFGFKLALAQLLTNLTQQEATISALSLAQAAGVIGFPTKAAMDADLAHADSTVGYVTNDATVANNTTYRKSGASGTGSWIVSSSTPTDVLRTRLNAMFEETYESVDVDYLYIWKDSAGRIVLAVKNDGKLQAQIDFAALAALPIGANGGLVQEYQSVDRLYAWLDSAGRVLGEVDYSGTLLMKVASPEIIAARGNRAEMGARISQILTPYGLPKRHVWGEWYLRETRQRLRALSLGDATQLKWAAIGDSWTQGASYFLTDCARNLIANYGNGGSGYASFGAMADGVTSINGNVDASIVTVTNSANWVGDHLVSPAPDMGMVTSSTVGAKVTVTGPASCSAVHLFYVGDATGAIRYRWNAGAWTALALTGSGLQVVPLAGIPAGAFTLELEVTAGVTKLCGVDMQSAASGVRVHKLGASGSGTNHWSVVDAAQWATGLQSIAPNLVTVMLGTNDVFNMTAATYRANLQIMLTRIKAALPSADVMIIMPPENARTDHPTTFMVDFAAQAYELAAINQCAFLDLQYLFGAAYAEYSWGSARPWLLSDLTHPTTAGGRAITDALLRTITDK